MKPCILIQHVLLFSTIYYRLYLYWYHIATKNAQKKKEKKSVDLKIICCFKICINVESLKIICKVIQEVLILMTTNNKTTHRKINVLQQQKIISKKKNKCHFFCLIYINHFWILDEKSKKKRDSSPI